MVVNKRIVLNENREHVHVQWTEKCGNEIDLIGQLNVAWLLGHSWGPARSWKWFNFAIVTLTLIQARKKNGMQMNFFQKHFCDYDSKILNIYKNVNTGIWKIKAFAYAEMEKTLRINRLLPVKVI